LAINGKDAMSITARPTQNTFSVGSSGNKIVQARMQNPTIIELRLLTIAIRFATDFGVCREIPNFVIFVVNGSNFMQY
jgi:hypothetical protein